MDDITLHLAASFSEKLLTRAGHGESIRPFQGESVDETKTRAYPNALRVQESRSKGAFEWFSQLALILRTVEGLRTPIALRSASAEWLGVRRKRGRFGASVRTTLVEK